MRARWLVLAGAAALLPVVGSAQRAVTVRADNDAFNFWQQPWARPDEEYTSGVRLVLEYDGAAWWARHARPLVRFLASCSASDTSCASHRLAIGQDIYTGARAKGSPVALPGGRPDAGLLWLSSTSRTAHQTSLTEFGWTIGLTGKASLAEPTQRFFHNLAPSWNRPIAWGAQMPTEPAFAAQVDRWRFVQFSAGDVQPHAGASVGTLLTELRSGIAARLGHDLPHPWRRTPRATSVNVSLEGDVTLHGVVRNEMLDGTVFRPSVHVTPRRLVSDTQVGARVRWRGVELAWIAHQTSAEYTSRRSGHTWSTLEVGWRPAH